MVAFVILAIACCILSMIFLVAELYEDDEYIAFFGLIFCVLMTFSIPLISAPAKEIPAYTSTIEPYTFVAKPLVWIEKETSESLEP